MSVDDDNLTLHIRNQDLVRIERSAIDTRALQAFLLGFSDALLAVVYVHDFHLDGLLFLRRDTITDISVNATAEFQLELLKDAGDITDEKFLLPHTIRSFSSLLAEMPQNKILILEQESFDDSKVWIGRYVWRENGTHQIHEFTGAGNWHDDLTELELDSITCCQLDTNYIHYYQRYFDSHGFPKLPG